MAQQQNNRNVQRRPRHRRNVNYGQLACILLIIVILILIASEAGRLFRRHKSQDSLLHDTHEYTPPETTLEPTEETEVEIIGTDEKGETITKIQTDVVEETTEFDENTGGYNLTTLSFEDTKKGSLILVDDSHPYQDTKVLESFLHKKTDSYRLMNFNLLMDAEAMTAVNQLMDGFCNATGLANVMLYSTQEANPESMIPQQHPERATGYAMDLTVLGESSASRFDGTGAYSWIPEHCAEYGFILRYPEDKSAKTGNTTAEPWHYRYVGTVHSMAMQQNNWCLEEYLEEIKNSGPNQKELSVLMNDGTIWHCYYFKAKESGTTQVPVPETENFTLSGDNMGGFVIAYQYSETAEEVPQDVSETDALATETELSTDAGIANANE